MKTLAFIAAFFLLSQIEEVQAAPILKVSVIHATKKGNFDPGLKQIKSSLKRAFAGYQGFKQLNRHTLKLKKRKVKKLNLPNKQPVHFKYKGKKRKSHKVNLSIPKSRVNLDLSIPERKVFFHAGIRYKKGILILALYLR